jgi:hypothetical protein
MVLIYNMFGLAGVAGCFIGMSLNHEWQANDTKRRKNIKQMAYDVTND